MKIVFENSEKLKNTLNAVEDGTSITIALNAEHTLTHAFSLDNTLTDVDIMRYLAANSEKFFGRLATELCLDYKKIITDHEKQNSMIVFAAHRAIITDIQAVFLQQKKLLKKIQPNNENDINLLPWRELLHQKKKKYIFCRLIVYIVIFCLFATLFNFFIIKSTAALQLQLISLKNKIQHIHLSNVKKDQRSLFLLNKIHTEKQLTEKLNMKFATIFLAIANQLPSEIVLISISSTQKKIIITGIANQLSDIQQYNSRLAKTLKLQQSTLANIQVDPKNTQNIHFIIQAIL